MSRISQFKADSAELAELAMDALFTAHVAELISPHIPAILRVDISRFAVDIPQQLEDVLKTQLTPRREMFLTYDGV